MKHGRPRRAADYRVIWCMHFAWWITRATDIYSEYVVLIAFPRQRWFRGTRVNITFVEASWNVMAQAQKPDFIFRAKRTSPFKPAGGWGQFSRLLAAEVCASAVVMLDTPCSEVVWRVLATHSIRQFPLHVTSRASPCTITFQLDSTAVSFLNLATTSTCVFKVTVKFRPIYL